MKSDCFARSPLDPSYGQGTESVRVKMNLEARLSLNHPHSRTMGKREGKVRLRMTNAHHCLLAK